MNKPNIQTTKQVVPMLYGYSTPEVIRHNGWTKIGYTEQDVETRINQQTHTADIKWKLEWKGNATFDDGSGETFIDKDFHAYLRKSGIEQEKGKNNEWFHVDGVTSKQMFRDFREDHGILKTTDTIIPYKLRDEQQSAVAMTVNYLASHENGEFLWNAKPRFGKTLSVYDFVQKTGAEKVLIVTNRPAISNSWFSDYSRFLGSESGYLFVSEVDALKGKIGVLTREEYTHFLSGEDSGNAKCIEFVSLQDMKGSIYFGGQYDKLGEVAKMEWDILVIDEAHEGVDTYKHFDGQLFDSVVFDDSVKEFLALKKKLADYFDEKSVEDIFDYIPPQKTNQIFTPKTMVKKMVDMLEQENPGCFDMPDKTFIDLYMKSGLYITEIVKRLYQSDEMKKQFPDNKERLKHIFEKQVYGLAPTEIIYKIATSYILGFDEDTKDIKHNFRQLDALPYAKDGTLEQVLEELYPGSSR